MKIKMKNLASFTLALLLCLSLLPFSAKAAYGTLDFPNDETHLRTAYGEDNYLDFSVLGNQLTVSGKLRLDGLTGVMLKCDEERIYLDVDSGNLFALDMTLTHDGVSTADIYTKVQSESSYWSCVWERICLEKTASGYRIVPSLVLEHNLTFFRASLDPARFRDSSKVPAAVRKLSNEIVGSETDDYTKLFLLHKWVAENIYYDYDAYYSKTYSGSPDILANKRGVCAGYASLLKNLILAQNIPCFEASTYALGLGNHGSYATDTTQASIKESNHAHVEAWADGHWVVMDPTWDSNNKYQGGTYQKREPNGFYYFDITPEAFALDHKYIERADGQIVIQNGKVVNKTKGKTAETTRPTTKSVTATPTQSTVLVNGQQVSFDAYNIGGNNYFKLRDLAQALRGSAKQFDVVWYGEANIIELFSGQAYTSVGGELAQGSGTAKTANSTTSAIYRNGAQASLSAYNIGGNNYFKLRDLGRALDFDVVWDAAAQTIRIDGEHSYGTGESN